MSDNSNLKTLVPTFIIHLNGSRLSAEKEADVKNITIIEKVDAPSSFSLRVSDMNREWADSNDLTVGAEIKITLGYKDEVEELFNGEITKLSPEFKQNSDGVLIINGSNHLHRLLRAKKTRSFTEMTDSDIIKEIASDSGLKDDIEDVGSEHLFTMQRNQTDYDYLMTMTNKYNCKAWAKDKTLFFKKLEKNSGEDIVVEWGKTLLEFYPVIDTINLMTESEVRGWDNEKAEVIIGNSTIDDITIKVGGDDLGAKMVKDNFGEMKNLSVDENIIDQKNADKAALDIITKNSMGYIMSSGKSEGNNKIRAGMIIQINEVGGKFSGKYYVNTVIHVLSTPRGYSTYFNVTRNTT